MFETQLSNVKTNYFKIGHLKNLTYTIYTSQDNTNNDQELLELELTIRHQYPNSLITYYNKSLFHFTINNEEQNLDVKLNLKFKDTVSVEKLSNPPKGTDDDYLAFANVSFAKAVKKMILYNLALKGVIKLFGNYCIYSTDSLSYSIICMDPILLSNGDLLLSCTERNLLKLYNSSIVSTTASNDCNFVIYILPSGIRCHLFDTTNIQNNFVNKPQLESEKLLRLLELSTQCDLKETLWVKLIPNLKHLNNQTSLISKFIHSVENKKFILWPWCLCLLQFGLKEHNNTDIQKRKETDPLQILSAYLDFKVKRNLESPPTPKSASPPSVSTEQTPALEPPAPSSVPSVNATIPNPTNEFPVNMTTPFGSDVYNLQATDNFFNKPENPDNMEIDDLFGKEDGSQKEKKIDEKPGNEEKESDESMDDLFGDFEEDDVPESKPDETDVIGSKAEANGTTVEVKPEVHVSIEKRKLPYIETLKNKMTMNNFTPDYKDPGAPAPVNQTPMIAPPTSIDIATTTGNIKTNDITSTPKSKSSFSPIVFNPIIQKDIDDKYGKGGKFYYEKDNKLFDKSIKATTRVGNSDPNDSSDESSESSNDESDEDDNIIQDDHGNSFIPTAPPAQDFNNTQNATSNTFYGSPVVNKVGFKTDSPFTSSAMMTPNIFDTPHTHRTGSSSSSSIISNKDLEFPKISESSNYLPLILRNVNISSIPDSFLLNNLSAIPSFSMMNEYSDNDLEISHGNEMITKIKDIKELLHFISSNIVFDLGLFANITINSEVEYQIPSASFLEKFKEIFPLSYQTSLIEFVHEILNKENDDPLHFFGEEESINKQVNDTEWNVLETQSDKFDKYNELLTKLNVSTNVGENEVFKIPEVKIKVEKNGNLLNLNSLSLDFWNYLNFKPINSPKSFQILVIGKSGSYANEFLNRLSDNYSENHFGHISRLNLSTVDTRSDLEPISDGLLLLKPCMNYGELYLQLNQKLNSLVELIKLDLINKTNKFEFDRPLLLLFVNFDSSFNSILQISKVLRNFKVALLNYQVPLVQIFTKIIPSSLIVRSPSNLKVFSNYTTTKLSMVLYNECPNEKNIVAPIAREPPTKIQFKFMNGSYRDNNNTEDSFLHIAYERSIDKSWLAAAWSDPFGSVNQTKSWYCSRNNHDIGSIADEIWNISTELFKSIDSPGGKKFLVLTRINSVIPDDELVHWKRLSMKFKDISLIVLSVNRSPKLIFSKTNSLSDDYILSEGETSNAASILVTSPNGLAFHSPQQFLNAPSNFLSPQDAPTYTEPDMILKDGAEIFGMMPKVQLPSFNSPSRASMKVGYLIKEHSLDQLLIYEVNLLSCSNYWNLDTLMRIILMQYKKLITLNNILGISGFDKTQLVPWHINAVGKLLNYLVHIYVEE
ncbi:SSN2 [Candida pseudojiufengensis]|uniref:SSN2 n=1 Tax=Candida pseudojiufengensis TaxID=497109 RepID=UPI0022252E5B|nr:SSN2 [Candida pseudojiufengensis]KAI5960671.1 SSN2 [Candida pseudojiufengensis]